MAAASLRRLVDVGPGNAARSRAPRVAELVTLEHRDPDARILAVVSGWPRPENPSNYIAAKRQMDTLEERRVRYEALFIHGYRTPLAYALAVVKLLALNTRRPKYDIVHAHGGEAALAACFYRRAPVVISYWGSDVLGDPDRSNSELTPQQRLRRWLIRQASRAAARTITKSAEMERSLPLRQRGRNTVIPNGVDSRAFRPSSQLAARAALGWKPHERIALFVGDPARRGKRYSLAVQAVAEARSEIPDLRLEVAHGVAPDLIPVFMNAADCLVHLSSQEGSPNVVKEALMCNLPVVATEAGDIAELLEGVEPSFLVAPTAAPAAQALVECLAAPRRSNGRACSHRFASDRIAEQILAVYESARPGWDGLRSGLAPLESAS